MHEVIVESGDIDTITEAIVHERDTCSAVRFVVDLSAIDDVSHRQIDALAAVMADHPETEWVIRISDAAASAGHLDDHPAGVTMITGSDERGPTQVETDDG